MHEFFLKDSCKETAQRSERAEMAAKVYLKGDDKIAERYCGMKTLSIAADSNRIPAIIKVKYIRRSEIPPEFDLNNVNINQRDTYEYIMNKGEGYIGEETSIENVSIAELKETVRNITRIIENMETKQDQKLKRYQELLDKKVKLCKSLEGIRDIDEEELYNLHQSIELGYLNVNTKETDEELITRLRSESVSLYRKQSDIPEGKQYDKSRELLRAINRVRKNNSNRRKKGVGLTSGIVDVIGDLASSKSCVSSIAHEQNKNIVRPEHMVEQIVSSSGFIMEILSTDCNSILIDQIESKSDKITESLPDKQIVSSSGFLMETLPTDCNSAIPNILTMTELANSIQLVQSNTMISVTSMDQSNIYEICSEDIEANVDPLKAITWPEYYHANEFVQSYEMKRLTVLTGRPLLDSIFVKLHNSSMKNRGISISTREEYLLNEMKIKYKACSMKDPIIKYIEENVENLTKSTTVHKPEIVICAK